MDIHSIRQELKRKSIYDIPLRVTFYARVSSESDEQLNSLDNQISYFENLIKQNKSWTYIDGYIDEGLSGMSTKKRENFHKMVNDAKAGKFDLIITKEITRFARNTLDSLNYTRKLLDDGVAVYFKNDNINTIDEDGELRLTIMSGIAQDEVRKLSSRVKFGHQQAIQRGVVLGNSRIFGYVQEKGRLKIDDSEAPMIKELFALYSTGEYSMKQLEDLFWNKGYRNHRGNKIAHTTMSSIISNPKYKGYYVGNKVKVIDMFTKKQKFLPPEDWIMYKDETGNIVPAIVDENIWDRANEVLKKRSNDVKNRKNISNHANLFTGKLICSHCGVAYYRRDAIDQHKQKNSKWVCSGRIKNGAESCPSFTIYESEIIPILKTVFAETKGNTENIVEKYIKMYNQLYNKDDVTKKINNYNSLISAAQKKKIKLLGFNTDGKLSDEDFINMNNDISGEIRGYEELIAQLNDQLSAREEFQQHISKIRQVLRDVTSKTDNGVINKNFVDKYIDKIFVSPEGGRMKLSIKLFTGDFTEQYLESLNSGVKVRSGHTFKKMIPERTYKYTRNDRTKDGHVFDATYSCDLFI